MTLYCKWQGNGRKGINTIRGPLPYSLLNTIEADKYSKITLHPVTIRSYQPLYVPDIKVGKWLRPSHLDFQLPHYLKNSHWKLYYTNTTREKKGCSKAFCSCAQFRPNRYKIWFILLFGLSYHRLISLQRLCNIGISLSSSKLGKVHCYSRRNHGIT